MDRSGRLHRSRIATAVLATRRPRGRLSLVAGASCLALALGGCGVGVAAGGENAATHPATGIFVSPTVGAGNVSGHPQPVVAVQPPPNTPPSPLPPGLAATESAIKSAISGGCWEDAHAGNFYGAYDQLFWWEGDCATSVGDQVTVELYPSAAKAAAEAHHPSPDALQARFLSGAVLVDVYTSASPAVVSELSSVRGLKPVPGYGGA
jgi:hypothetical protein